MTPLQPEIVRIVEAERDRERSAQAILRAVAERRRRRSRRADGWLAAMLPTFRRSMGPDAHAPAPQALDRVQEALEGLQFGQVTVIVQDGIVVQVERTDRVRLPRRAGPGR